MRVRELHRCDKDNCQMEPTYAMSTDDGSVSYWVCPRHRSWAEGLIYMEEHPA